MSRPRQFDIHPEDVATALRKLADDIERREALPSHMVDAFVRSAGCFPERRLIVRYVCEADIRREGAER